MGSSGINRVHGAVEVCGYRIYGTPWQPEFCDWAFNLPRNGKELREVCAKIPGARTPEQVAQAKPVLEERKTQTSRNCVDILLSHGPPLGHNDRPTGKFASGCEVLRDAI